MHTAAMLSSKQKPYDKAPLGAINKCVDYAGVIVIKSTHQQASLCKLNYNNSKCGDTLICIYMLPKLHIRNCSRKKMFMDFVSLGANTNIFL